MLFVLVTVATHKKLDKFYLTEIIVFNFCIFAHLSFYHLLLIKRVFVFIHKIVSIALYTFTY